MTSQHEIRTTEMRNSSTRVTNVLISPTRVMNRDELFHKRADLFHKSDHTKEQNCHWHISITGTSSFIHCDHRCLSKSPHASLLDRRPHQLLSRNRLMQISSTGDHTCKSPRQETTHNCCQFQPHIQVSSTGDHTQLLSIPTTHPSLLDRRSHQLLSISQGF